MTVLRTEVWLSIVAALVLTGFMIWLLDKYSPYSARNNAEAYPYPCREFTLKESLWFALTSFTPQGGGEAPKALSGRTLVAAYWLFVVLMLATFTANLAAFLTVERMQGTCSGCSRNFLSGLTGNSRDFTGWDVRASLGIEGRKSRYSGAPPGGELRQWDSIKTFSVKWGDRGESAIVTLTGRKGIAAIYFTSALCEDVVSRRSSRPLLRKYAVVKMTPACL
ncbi:Ionotropic receptor 25a [Eumeta japonica]|uniref:Ionotropic receptor 25a n=1 Tax=Eumeta variegata TaxID=151549 RepID=A0A4C1XYY1_EUMVA|nr:Ionotropic receptor 25a [Eumeta japonica]